MKRGFSNRLIWLGGAVLLFASCDNSTAQPIPISTPTPSYETLVITPEPAPLEPGSATNPADSAPGFWIQPGVPGGLSSLIAAMLTQAGFSQLDRAENAALKVVLAPGPEASLTAEWIYAVAVPFPTIPDDIVWEALQRYWQGDLDALAAFGGPTLFISPDVAALLSTRMGEVDPGTPLQIVAGSDQLAEMAWDARPAISILPFEQLTPRWKALTLDGQSVFDRSLDVGTYPLVARVGAVPKGEAGAQALAMLQQAGVWQTSNRDPSRLLTVVMTGVTALARATAMQIELRGVDFPAENILPFFADADILHTSNEVSFTPQCPPPNWVGEPKFCSSPDYFPLLQHIGLDAVELTGNHNLDYGAGAASYSLDLYEAKGIAYFGGGRNLADAKTPRVLAALDGTRVAFLGCNSAGPYTAWATDAAPGSAPCDDWEWIKEQIATLKADDRADVVIVTLQYVELDRYDPSPEQRTDFEALALAGADIVSGSQAHQPQGFSFVDGTFIHFGVGNLFFDQMDFIENRQMFADKHVFYEGRHISTVLFTGMMEAYAQPRPMTPDERAAFLQTIFGASGW